MRCSLFLAAGMNYLARGKDRLTLAILFLVPLMTVVVNIHRQTPFPLLHNSLLSDWEKYLDSFNARFFPAPERSMKNISFFFSPVLPFIVPMCVFESRMRGRVFVANCHHHHFPSGIKSGCRMTCKCLCVPLLEFARSRGDIWPLLRTKAPGIQNIYPFMFKRWPA